MTQHGVIIVWLIFLLTRDLLIMSWDWLILLALVYLNLVVFVLQVSSSQLACNLLGLAYIASSSTFKLIVYQACSRGLDELKISHGLADVSQDVDFNIVQPKSRF